MEKDLYLMTRLVTLRLKNQTEGYTYHTYPYTGRGYQAERGLTSGTGDGSNGDSEGGGTGSMDGNWRGGGFGDGYDVGNGYGQENYDDVPEYKDEFDYESVYE